MIARYRDMTFKWRSEKARNLRAADPEQTPGDRYASDPLQILA